VKKCVVSLAMGETSRRYGEVTFPLMQDYAKRHGADFHVFFGSDPTIKGLGYQKLQYAELRNYDSIFHIDTDAVIKRNAESVWDLMGDADFAAVDELAYECPEEGTGVKRAELVHSYGTRRGNPFFPKKYYNVGIFAMKMGVMARMAEEEREENQETYSEQTHITFLLTHWGLKVHDLPPSFNYMSLMERRGVPRSEARIIHYAGGWFGYSPERVIGMMRSEQ